MLDLQHTPLPDETEYMIDGLCEDTEIDGPTALLLRLYGDRPHIAQMTARSCPGDLQWFRWRRSFVGDLVGYADTLFNCLPIEQRGAMVSIGLAHVQSAIERSARYMAQAAITDRVEGGMCESYNRPPRAYKKDDVTPYPKDMRRLRSPNWIRRYVKRDEESGRVRAFANPVLIRAASVPRETIRGGMAALADIMAESERRRRAHDARQWEQVHERMDMGMTAVEAIQVRLKPGVRQKLRLQRRAYKKTARRAAATATTLVGAETVSAFISGAPVNLTGQNLMFGVQLRSGVARAGHGCISVSVATRDAEPLATLCYYVEDTPALDQLTAVALHAYAGEELSILEAANLTSVTPAGAVHPLIAGKAQRFRTAEAENWIPVDSPAGRRLMAQVEKPYRDVGQLRSERDAAYWEMTKDVWLESLGVTALGVRGRKLMLQNAEMI